MSSRRRSSQRILCSAVKEVYGNRDKYKDAMAKSGQMDSIATIIDLINSQVKKSS